MSANCLHCGAALRPGQSACAECGKRTQETVQGKARAGAPGAPSRSGSPGAGPQPARRDKARDFSLVGKSLAGKYKVLEVLGQGGFGTVYRVEITAGMVGEQLALKILPEELSSQTAFREQFLNEIRVAMRVVDRYIAQIRDVGATETGQLYYTMDLCPGFTLAQILKAESKLPVTRTLLIVLNVLRGLQTAHAAGIIHRDLKPANIMVQSQGGKDTVRILDFGIATALQTGGERPKGFAGSPHYMPPEQFLGEPLGFHTDLYSIGVILYECLSGTKPYSGSSAQEVFKSLKASVAQPLSEIAPETAEFPGLSEIVMKAIEKNPDRRYQSARELFDAVNGLLAHATSPAAPVATDAVPARAEAQEEARQGAQTGPAVPPAARVLAGRIRRRRSAAFGPRPGSHASAVALGTFIIAGTIVGVVFHQNIIVWWNSFKSAPGESTGPTLQSSPAVKAPVATSTPKSQPVEPRPSVNEKPLEAQKASARAELEARLAQLLDDSRKASAAGNWPVVVERSETAIGLDAGNAEAHWLRGAAALKLLDLKTAEAELSRAYGLYAESKSGDGSTAELLVSLVEVKMSLAPTDLDAPETLGREALKRWPKDPAVVEVLARVLDRKGKRPEAKKLLESAKASKIESKSLEELSRRFAAEDGGKLREQAEELSARARDSYSSGDFIQAVGLANRSREILPTEAGYTIGADALAELQQNKMARALLNEAQSLAASGTLKLASNSALEGRLELLRGLETLQGAEDPPSAESIASARATLDGAREKLSRAGDAGGTAPRLQRLAAVALAEAHARRGDSTGVDQALGSLGADTDGGPSIDVARILARLAGAVKGKEEQIKVHRRASLQLERLTKTESLAASLRAESSFLLGSSYLALGGLENKDDRFKAAIASFAAAEKAGWKTRELYESWAQAYDRVGNLIRAAQLYRSAYELAPSAQTCLRAVDYFLNANPKSPEARELLKQARSLFKGNAELEKKCREVLE